MDSPTKKALPYTDSKKLTKRMILSKLDAIFDPIGGGVAILIKAKIAMQELWQLGLSRDDDVPPDIRKKWMVLFDKMAALNEVKLKRCLTPLNVASDPWLIIFCDASFSNWCLHVCQMAIQEQKI